VLLVPLLPADGLGGRKSLDNGRPGLNHPGLDAAVQWPASEGGGAASSAPSTTPSSAAPDAAQQQQHSNQHQAQQPQQQPASVSSPEPDQTGPRPPQTLNCHTGDTKGLDAYLRSVPGSPSATSGGDGAGAAAGAAAASAIAAAAAGHQAQQHAGAVTTTSSRAHAAACAARSAPPGSGVSAASHSNNHRLHEASRTPLDEELGSCPPYAAKAVWGLRYTMEDKWAAVPNLMQVCRGAAVSGG
jgi:hypothetical protein